MFSLLLLIAICVGYYYLHKYYPREDKDHIYFGIFVSIGVVLIYLFNFEQGLIYKIFHNIHDIHKKPLYDMSVFQENSDPTDTLKMSLLKNQGQRCGKCMNYIMDKDTRSMFLSYKVPLQQGGQNSPDNLMIICYSCNSYNGI